MINDTTKSFGTHSLRKCNASLLRRAQSMPANWFGRRGALILRKLVLKQKQPIIDAVVDGLKFRLYMNDNVSERKFLFLPQFFDCFERDIIKEKIKEGDVFIDIGANAGIYTMRAANCVGDTGKVISIEPNPTVSERLLFNAKLNNFEKRIQLESCGVSDEEGSFDLTLDESNLGGSSLVVSRSDKKITVNCYQLTSILKKNNIEEVAGLKIDIEGAEDKALIPFFRDADKKLYPKLLILENSPHDWKEDLLTHLKTAGYTHLKTTRMNQVWVLD